MNDFEPFVELEKAEALLRNLHVSDDADANYLQLTGLLTQERTLDRARPSMYETYGHQTERSEDYVYREYMVRRKISEFAAKLDREITDKIDGFDSALAMYIRHKELYPEPVRRGSGRVTRRRKMNILAISDRKPKIDIASYVKSNNVDLIITLGDFAREDLLQLKDVIDIPKIGVYGNHDSGLYMEEIGIQDMHLHVWEYQGISFGGFEGCVRYKDNPDAIMYTQEQASAMMMGFPAVDVFLCHCPPRGINDEEEVAHQGFDALREYVDSMHPKFLLHGHTYPTDETRITQSGPTRIEYVFGYKLITLDMYL